MGHFTVFLLPVVIVMVTSSGEGRSTEGLVQLERALSNSLEESGREKRALFDPSCKGVYSRQLFKKLDRVCDDCFNLYRKPMVATSCRSNCYANDIFEGCLYHLLTPDSELFTYSNYVKMVGK